MEFEWRVARACPTRSITPSYDVMLNRPEGVEGKGLFARGCLPADLIAVAWAPPARAMAFDQEKVMFMPVWKLSKHLLLCGSALEKESYQRLMGDDRA
jgi:hypothetical protein